MNKTLLLAACCAMLAAGVTAQASDADPGQALSKPCVVCHGPDGNSQSAEFPRIAGQHYDYLVKVLKDYKSGARKSPIMAPQAANLTPRDIEELAAYYSKQKGLVVKY
jgi:cytochrome c553